jgi:hypothetical protein
LHLQAPTLTLFYQLWKMRAKQENDATAEVVGAVITNVEMTEGSSNP